MALYAATATAEGWSWYTWLILIVLGLLCAGVYALACWIWPIAKCKKCDGSGKRMSPSGKYWGPCRRCKGKAARLRTGRRIFNWLHITKEASK